MGRYTKSGTALAAPRPMSTMRITRILALLVVLTGIAWGVVRLRTAQTQLAALLVQREGRRTELRRELWEWETKIARFKTPQRIAEMMEKLPIEMMPPVSEPPLRGPTTLIVDRR